MRQNIQNETRYTSSKFNYNNNYISFDFDLFLFASLDLIGFREHLSTHNDSYETRVQCSYCSAWLKNRVSLKTHVRRTHKSTPKKCPYCEKIKPNQQSLTSHILVVHTKPSHQCTICDKSFTKALSLTVC